MISDGFDVSAAVDIDALSILTGKLTSERARERMDAMTAIKARFGDAGIPSTVCNMVVEAVCARLPLEAATTVNYHNNNANNNNVTASAIKKTDYAQSKAAVAVRDCKWAVQCALQAGNGRLDPNLVRCIVKTINGLAADMECLGEFVASVCNRLLFSNSQSTSATDTIPVTVWAIGHGDGLWERCVTSIVKAMTTVNGQRRPVIPNEADLLIFLMQMCRNAPRRSTFVQSTSRIMQIALSSFSWSANLPDLATFSAATDLMMVLCQQAHMEGCLLELHDKLNGFGLDDMTMWSWMRHRALAHQSGVAEWLLFLMGNGIDVLVNQSVEEAMVEEVSVGRLGAVNISALDVISQQPSVSLFHFIGRALPFARLKTLIGGRFPEYRMFQILAACRSILPCEYLYEKLEKSGREAQPFILLCLVNCMSASNFNQWSWITQVFKYCGIVALKPECREPAILLMTVIIRDHLSCLSDVDLIDQQMQLLLTIMDTKEPSTRFATLVITYLESRFEYEYWTGVGKRMYEQVAMWMYSYHVNYFSVDLLKRFLALPFAPVSCPHEDNIWSAFQQRTVTPTSFDIEYLNRLVRCHQMTTSHYEELIKLTVRQIETIKPSNHLPQPSPHTLTIVDSLHHSPHYRPSAEVNALLLVHAILDHSQLDSLLLTDAQKYLWRKLSLLDVFQFKAFVESTSANLALVESVCVSVMMEKVLVRPDHLNDPSFADCAVKILCQCQQDLPDAFVRAVFNLIFTGKTKCTCEQLLSISRFIADKKLFVDFVDLPGTDVDFIHSLCKDEDIIGKRMISKASTVGVVQFTKWLNSKFLSQRGHLFMDVVCSRWQHLSHDNSDYILGHLSSKMVRLLVPALRRLLDNSQQDTDNFQSLLNDDRLASPVLVKYIAKTSQSMIESFDFAIEQIHGRTKPRSADKYMVIAFAISQHADIGQYGVMSPSDWFLCWCQYSKLFDMLPFDSASMLSTAFNHKAHIHDYMTDQLIKASLLVDQPVDKKRQVVRLVIDLIKRHRITVLPHSFPLLLYLHVHHQLGEEDLFAGYDKIVKLCAKEPYEGAIESKYVDIIVKILSFCDDDLFQYIMTSACELLRFHATAKALAEGRPHLKLSLDWQTDTGDCSSALVVSMFKSMTAQIKDLYTFVDWAIYFKADLSIDSLVDIDERFHDFLVSASRGKWHTIRHHNNNNHDDSIMPAHLSQALHITRHHNCMQAEILFHAFLSLEGNQNLVESFFKLLQSNHGDIMNNVILKVIGYCGRSVDLLLKHHRALQAIYQTCRWSADEHLSAAYCHEALRLTYDPMQCTDQIVEHFKQVDWCNSLDRTVDHVRLLTSSTSNDDNDRHCGQYDGVEMAILSDDCWKRDAVPKGLVQAHDRLVYSQAKLQLPINSADPFILMAGQCRRGPLDIKVVLSWIDDMTNSVAVGYDDNKNNHLTRLVKMTDLIAKLYDGGECQAALQLKTAMLAGKMLRRRGMSDEAVLSLKSVLTLHRSTLATSHPAMVATALTKLGGWLAQGKSAVAKDILESYLEPAYRLSPPNSPCCAKSCYKLAWFLDRQYAELESSDLIHAKARYIQYSKRQLDLLRQSRPTHSSTIKSWEKSVHMLEVQLAIDQDDYNRLVKDKTAYLQRLLESYLKVLQMSNDHDVVVFRFCSIWFAASHGNTTGTTTGTGSNTHNGGHEDVEAVCAKIGSILAAVPSHKFLPVVYQLAAKYQTLTRETRMYALLTSLLRRLLFKHPYHSVMQFIALSGVGQNTGRHAGRLKRSLSSSMDDSSSSPPDHQNNARDLLTVSKSTSPVTADQIKAIEQCAAAYAELAEMPVDVDVVSRPNGGGQVAIPKHMLIHRLPMLSSSSSSSSPVPILTAYLEPRPDGNYQQALVHVTAISTHFRVIGGINLPKIVDVTGSDGVKYRQLVKGKDDLRQDAVVEQVFRLVNRMIQVVKGVSRLRCYRVVPLHQRAGVLEWVTDAVPIGDYLQSAHHVRHNQDNNNNNNNNTNTWTLSHCRQLARQEAERPGSTMHSKLQLFLDIHRHLPAVFHLFLTERFLTTAEWLQARHQFASSCASSSMMGYVMGLGDRHCQNILVDCKTGQLCHIDLNMIFEQGKTLRVPERVPFRLTREMVSAMGPRGVDHGFRQSATLFMSQIRLHADNVLMVLEVFKHDPLHHWPTRTTVAKRRRIDTVVFDKLSDLQSPHDIDDDDNNSGIDANNTTNTTSTGFDMADRALLRVKEKVSGREEGAQVSVAAQVESLVQQATSAEALCQMYCGWQPWL